MKQLHTLKPLLICADPGGTIRGRDPRACRIGKDDEPSPQEGVLRFLKEFTSTVLSTVAARSKLGQGLSCFYTEKIVGGNNHNAFFLLGHILDGLLALG